jgi:hypothetical protein
VRGAIKAALSDFYFNSLRLLAANIVWGVWLVATIALVYLSPLFAIPAAIGLALPTAGIFRIAALIARDEPASLTDALVAARSKPLALPALLTGAAVIGAVIVLGFNVVIGLVSGQTGWVAVGTLAAWGLLALFIGACAFWPLLMDPVRHGESLRKKVELALEVAFRAPARFAGLTLITAAIVVLSTVAFAALLSISVSFVALLLCRYVLPTADRLEGRATYAEPILD